MSPLYERNKTLMIYCLSYFLAKPHARKELIKALLFLREPTYKEPGCIEYELFQDEENPDLLIVSEKFVSHKALDEHESEPYIVDFIEGPMKEYAAKVTWHVLKPIFFLE